MPAKKGRSAETVTGMSQALGGPRGLLWLYILNRLSTEPTSGYGFMSHLNTITEGSWHPGSGSIYPILKELESEGLIRVASTGSRSKSVYTITSTGKEALASGKELLDKFTIKWNKVRSVMLDLLSPQSQSSLVLEMLRGNQSMWQSILTSDAMDKNEKTFKLREYALLLEAELAWTRKTIEKLSR